MSKSVKKVLESIVVDCKCPFKTDRGRSRSCTLSELVFLAGYCDSEELGYIDRSIKTKIECGDLTDAQRALLVQVHEEIKTFYDMAAQEVNEHREQAIEPVTATEPTSVTGP